jgi:Tol biopolymer transport system component
VVILLVIGFVATRGGGSPTPVAASDSSERSTDTATDTGATDSTDSSDSTVATLPSDGIVFGTPATDGTPIEVIDPADGSTSDLAASPGFNAFPSLSFDRSLMAYAHSSNPKPGDADNLELHLVNADGSNDRILATDLARDGWSSLSPDNSEIVFPSTRDGQIDLFVLTIDTGDVRQLTDDAEKESDPTWSADGTTIAFTLGPNNHAQVDAIDPDGSNRRTLFAVDTNSSNANFAPDGSAIVFSSTRNGRSQIFVSGVDGSDQKVLVDQPDTNDIDPRWSADSTAVIFVSVPQSGPPTLKQVNFDGTDLKDVTPPNFSGSAVW